MQGKTADVATEQGEIAGVLRNLTGRGRVEVEPVSTSDPVHLETPAGEIRFMLPVDAAWRRGADFTRFWYFGALKLSYSVDRTPGNRTHTILVEDTGDVEAA